MKTEIDWLREEIAVIFSRDLFARFPIRSEDEAYEVNIAANTFLPNNGSIRLVGEIIHHPTNFSYTNVVKTINIEDMCLKELMALDIYITDTYPKDWSDTIRSVVERSVHCLVMEIKDRLNDK